MALLSVTAASHGLTLTAATAVVFAEILWTPSQMQQAEDRVHRIGQHSSVNVYYLHAPRTVDDACFRILNEKMRLINSSLDGGRQ